MRDMDLENSVITRTMRDGIDNEAGRMGCCPVCGAETDEYAVNREGVAVGCRECIAWWFPWEYEDGKDET